MDSKRRPRARELGIEVGMGSVGPFNAITDVPGVRVGYSTVIKGDGPLIVGEGPVRTGVTVIVPRTEEISEHPLFAGCHRLNGNGELTGLEWIRESGLLTSPIALTNTHSVGVVRDALVRREIEARGTGKLFWSLPIVGETWDGCLNDINGQHLGAEHVFGALADASSGSVAEGNVGGGTGMVCHDFKGGTGTSSRVVAIGGERFTVGVIVQANHGARRNFVVNGAPVGRLVSEEVVPPPILPELGSSPSGVGSIICVIATDAPLLPIQLQRVAQRAGFGIARLGAFADHYSGDLFLAFSTANSGLPAMSYGTQDAARIPVEMLSLGEIDPIFEATVEATTEAILNAMLAAETMIGRDGVTATALDGDELVKILDRYGRRTLDITH
ncbi:MAG: P1 family peptidase [Acidimicrobiaceae bacterium]|nr:P1 family peptidase [Acidimicrobiaceae bacterium]